MKYLCKTAPGTSMHAEMSVGNSKVEEAAPPTALLFNEKKKKLHQTILWTGCFFLPSRSFGLILSCRGCVAGYFRRFCFVCAVPGMISVCEDLKRECAVTRSSDKTCRGVGKSVMGRGRARVPVPGRRLRGVKAARVRLRVRHSPALLPQPGPAPPARDLPAP